MISTSGAVQVQRWLGHHSPSFTLSTYVHLLGDDMGEPLDISGAMNGATSHPEKAQDTGTPIAAEAAS
jgi:hypothetical protein